jgi:hypothetical protein
MSELLGRSLDAAALAADLRAVDREHRASGGESWPEYYAVWFLRRAAGERDTLRK